MVWSLVKLTLFNTVLTGTVPGRSKRKKILWTDNIQIRTRKALKSCENN